MPGGHDVRDDSGDDFRDSLVYLPASVNIALANHSTKRVAVKRSCDKYFIRWVLNDEYFENHAVLKAIYNEYQITFYILSTGNDVLPHELGKALFKYITRGPKALRIM